MEAGEPDKELTSAGTPAEPARDDRAAVEQALPETATPAPPDSVETPHLSEYSRFYRKYLLIIEYKHLPARVPSGVYVVPSFTTLNVWYGVIFLRQGLYRRGIFKFIMTIPETYPDNPPTINFFSRVYHPQVRMDTGALNLESAFPSWTPHKNQLGHVLVYLKRMFYKPEAANAYNTEAAILWTTRISAFKEEADKCVEESLQNVYVNPENSSLCFTEWNSDLQQIRNHFLKKSEDDDGVLSWVSKGVSKLINIQY